MNGRNPSFEGLRKPDRRLDRSNPFALDGPGFIEGAYPSGSAPWAGFLSKYYTSPSKSEWYYIRWGEQALDGSGDFDTNGAIDEFDLAFFDECVTNALMLPGCRWADMDADTDVDCDDWTLFQLAWTAPVDPPTLSACFVADPIPTVSTWGAVVMALLTLTAGSLVFKTRYHPSFHVHAA